MDYKLNNSLQQSKSELKTPSQKLAQDLQRQLMENNLQLSKRIGDAQRQWGHQKQAA